MGSCSVWLSWGNSLMTSFVPGGAGLKRGTYWSLNQVRRDASPCLGRLWVVVRESLSQVWREQRGLLHTRADY